MGQKNEAAEGLRGGEVDCLPEHLRIVRAVAGTEAALVKREVLMSRCITEDAAFYKCIQGYEVSKASRTVSQAELVGIMHSEGSKFCKGQQKAFKIGK
ncbi:hypothetical protein MP228_010368 [Amoeboaphelidium protococcarum]|nr:hypothetical protein MP228_010368 [Amoeboaphelidium protococcarum]